jgi:hypothetical protein
MSKKDFTGNFNNLLGTAPAKKKKAAPKKPSAKKAVAKVDATVKAKRTAPAKKKVPVDSTRDGTKDGEKRASFIVKEVTVAKIKAIAYQDRKNIKEVLAEALEAYLQLWEEENGAIKL